MFDDKGSILCTQFGNCPKLCTVLQEVHIYRHGREKNKKYTHIGRVGKKQEPRNLVSDFSLAEYSEEKAKIQREQIHRTQKSNKYMKMARKARLIQKI